MTVQFMGLLKVKELGVYQINFKVKKGGQEC